MKRLSGSSAQARKDKLAVWTMVVAGEKWKFEIYQNIAWKGFYEAENWGEV